MKENEVGVGVGHIGNTPRSSPKNDTVGQPRVSSVKREIDFRVQRSHIRRQLPSEHKANTQKIVRHSPEVSIADITNK